MTKPKLVATLWSAISLPWHTALFALYIPVNLFALNSVIFQPAQTVRAVVVTLAISAVVFSLIALAVRRFHLSAMATTFLLVALWAPVLDSIPQFAILALALAVLVLIYRTSGSRQASFVANAIALGLLVQPALAMASGLLWHAQIRDRDLAHADIGRLDPAAAQAAKLRPNIFHITLDGYGSEAALREVLGFSNRDFIAGLQEQGFVVFPQARTPYSVTFLSMASIFSGNYLKAGAWPLTLEQKNQVFMELGAFTTYGPVRQALDSLGYKFLNVKPDLAYFQEREGDVIDRPEGDWTLFNPFEVYFIEKTAIKFALDFALANGLLADRRYEPALKALRHATRTRFFLDHDGPYLLYEHILAPHPPFIVDRTGAYTEKWLTTVPGWGDGDHITQGDPQLQDAYRQAYVEKLRYINAAIGRQIADMIEKVPGPKIVILHGDHGSGAYHRQETPKESCLFERFSPLLAIYASEPRLRARLQELSGAPFNLANIYRVLFDETFGTDFGLLDNKSYFVKWSRPQRPIELSEAQITAACPIPKE